MTKQPAEATPIRVVLIEDQPSILKKQVRLLAAFSELKLVGTARDGKSGLALVGEVQPDVVLLDLGLPDVSGIHASFKDPRYSTAVGLIRYAQIMDPELRGGGRGFGGRLMRMLWPFGK